MTVGSYRSEVAIYLMPEASKGILICVSRQEIKLIVQRYMHSGSFSSALRALLFFMLSVAGKNADTISNTKTSVYSSVLFYFGCQNQASFESKDEPCTVTT